MAASVVKLKNINALEYELINNSLLYLIRIYVGVAAEMFL